MAAMTITAPGATTLDDWHKLRAWAIAELAKRQDDAARDVPIHSRTRSEAAAALHAAEVAYAPFLALF